MLKAVEVGVLLLERAYAKINLTLDVLCKRADGYHEVDMVMQTVDLSDLIWLEETTERGIRVESNVSHLPRDSRNLAVAAAGLFMRYTGIEKGLHIRIDKQIPVAAGLAGGSADAAAVLRGLNRMWKTGYSLEELASLGASIGSDIPFCVHGGCAVARGRGERIEQVVHGFKPWVVLVKPAVFVSTADIYQALTPADYKTTPVSSKMVQKLYKGDFEAVGKYISNGLKATTFRLYPEVEQLGQRVAHVTNTKVHMSGSGPTLFCLAKTQSSAQRMYNALRGFTKEVHLSRFV